MKSKLFKTTVVLFILILLSTVVIQVSYSIATGDNSNTQGNKVAQAFGAPQAQDISTTQAGSPSANQTIVYTYDQLGQLVKVEYPNGTVITYTYDALGNRVNMAISTSSLSLDISLQAGWNMVSVPLHPGNSSVSAVFPGVAAVYTWDPVSKGYIMPATIEANKGYWVAVTGNTTTTITGTAVPGWTGNITAGWNMIGSVGWTTPASISNPNDNPDGSVQIFAYWWDPVGRTYIITTDIEPGKGYWIASVQDCTLTLP